MCLDKNDIKPKGDTFFKVFLWDNKLCWLIHDEKGKHTFQPDKKTLSYKPLKGNKFTSSEVGFHAFETQHEAEIFASMIETCWPVKTKVVKVKMTGLIQSGTIGLTESKVRKDVQDVILEHKGTKAQAFSFKEMEI